MDALPLQVSLEELVHLDRMLKEVPFPHVVAPQAPPGEATPSSEVTGVLAEGGVRLRRPPRAALPQKCAAGAKFGGGRRQK